MSRAVGPPVRRLTRTVSKFDPAPREATCWAEESSVQSYPLRLGGSFDCPMSIADLPPTTFEPPEPWRLSVEQIIHQFPRRIPACAISSLPAALVLHVRDFRPLFAAPTAETKAGGAAANPLYSVWKASRSPARDIRAPQGPPTRVYADLLRAADRPKAEPAYSQLALTEGRGSSSRAS